MSELEDWPLKGIRVIDFGQYVAGPAVGMMLADQGAEVIRVDPPSGPMWHSPANAFLNRNKQSILLDLKKREDNQIALDLISSADVLIENFRPGVMNRLGLGPDYMTRENPRLVYLSIPGFASTDEKRAHIQAWEGVISAATGLFTDQGINRILMTNGKPYYTPLTLASAYAASLSVIAVMTALLHRERSGLGDIVEVPIASAVLEGLVYNCMVFHDMPDRYKVRRVRELERRQAISQSLNLKYDELQALLDPTYRNYMCADGRPFYNETVGIQRHVIDALKLHGLYDVLVAEGFPVVDPWSPSGEWNEDDFATDGYTMPSQEWADRISSRLKANFLKHTSREWEQIYEEWHLPGAAQQTTKEWLNDEHANISGLIVTVNDPVYGPMRQPGASVNLKSRSDQYLTMRPAPRPDADRQAILKGLLHRDRAHSDRKNNNDLELPLSGLKILDITNVLGGPTISSTLARFGAEIIHIAPVVPSFEPAESIICGAQCGKGKRSLLLDLKAPEGHEILERLVKKVDLITFNGTDEQVTRLGISHDVLLSANPNIILCQLTAFGGPREGSRTNRLGYDDLAQAITGVMARFGGALQTPEEHAHVGTIDVMGGFLGAFASLLALYKLKRGGGPDLARASLATCGEMIQYPFMYDYEERPPFNEPCGRESLGESPMYRLYEASDGWFFFGAEAGKIADLAAIPELSDLQRQPECDVEPFLERVFKTMPLAYWINSLHLLDIGAHAADSMGAIRERHLVDQRNAKIDFDSPTFLFLRNDEHPSGYTIDLFAPIGMRFKHSAIRIPFDQPKFGTHSREILAELGYTDREITEMIGKGVVGSGWSEKYLPD